MSLRYLLPEEIAYAGSTMLQWERGDLDRPIFVDEIAPTVVDDMHLYLIAQIGATLFDEGGEEGIYSSRAVDGQCSSPAQHAHRREEAIEAIAVVAVQMRDEDPDDTTEVQTLQTELALSTLPAVYEEELIPKLYHL